MCANKFFLNLLTVGKNLQVCGFESYLRDQKFLLVHAVGSHNFIREWKIEVPVIVRILLKKLWLNYADSASGPGWYVFRNSRDFFALQNKTFFIRDKHQPLCLCLMVPYYTKKLQTKSQSHHNEHWQFSWMVLKVTISFLACQGILLFMALKNTELQTHTIVRRNGCSLLKLPSDWTMNDSCKKGQLL